MGLIDHRGDYPAKAYNYCSYCGHLWAVRADRQPSCQCHPDWLEQFPDQEAVNAALMLGGYPAVHAIELDVYERQDPPVTPLADPTPRR